MYGDPPSEEPQLPLQARTVEQGPASVENNHTRNLKFVDVTERYMHGAHSLAEQKSIRVYVMQDYLRQKSGSSHPVVPPVMAETISGHVGRFRIAKDSDSRPKSSAVGSSTREFTMFTDQYQENNTRNPGQAASLWSFSQDTSVIAESSIQGNPTESPFAEEAAFSQMPRLSQNLLDGTGRVDPFARLPIDASMEIHEMLHYCEQPVC